MKFTKYFKPGQKALLRSLDPALPEGRFEALTVYVESCGANCFELSLPYRIQAGENYPFVPGMPLELNVESMGLGIRVTGKFLENSAPSRIRVAIDPDLQAFQRRITLRVDTMVGLRFSRGKGTLRSLRERWEKNLRVLQAGKDLSSLQDFPRCRVNLSPGGIRFVVQPPVEVADLYLLLLNLGDGKPPICLLAEVVWAAQEEVQGGVPAGMQFLHILEEDRKRIASFVRECSQRGAKTDETEE